MKTVLLLVLPVFGSISAAVAAEPKLVLRINCGATCRSDLWIGWGTAVFAIC